MLHRKICQLYQHVIGTGVLAGLMLEMGMFHLLKSSQMNLKLFQFPPFAPQDSITTPSPRIEPRPFHICHPPIRNVGTAEIRGWGHCPKVEGWEWRVGKNR